MKSFFTAQTFRVVPRHEPRRVRGQRPARPGHRVSARAGRRSRRCDSRCGNVDSLPQSERFYAGGDTTIRGFALDRVGSRHGHAGGRHARRRSAADWRQRARHLQRRAARAGDARRSASSGFSTPATCSPARPTSTSRKLRSAVGGGVRYKSPFGPIRFDLGFKVNRQPGEGLTAWFMSFGQAF